MGSDSPDDLPPPSPKSMMAMVLFALLFVVLVVVPACLVGYILVDSFAAVGPSSAGNKPGVGAVLIGFGGLVIGAIGIFALQWYFLKSIFASLTAEGERASLDDSPAKD